MHIKKQPVALSPYTQHTLPVLKVEVVRRLQEDPERDGHERGQAPIIHSQDLDG